MSSLGDFTHSDRLNSNEAVPKFLFSPELIGRMQIARCCVNECAVQSEEVRTHNLIVRILSHWFSTAYGISTDTIVQFFDSIMRIGRKSIEWLFTEASPLTLKNFLWAFTCHRLALVFEELWLASTWKIQRICSAEGSSVNNSAPTPSFQHASSASNQLMGRWRTRNL